MRNAAEMVQQLRDAAEKRRIALFGDYGEPTHDCRFCEDSGVIFRKSTEGSIEYWHARQCTHQSPPRGYRSIAERHEAEKVYGDARRLERSVRP